LYRVALRNAQREVVIACAYFFPGYRFIRALTRAARRGVRVRLILQGRPDIPISALAASVLYDVLLAAGIEVYHYVERPLHAKVAVVDERWATVGSSNLDPTSLGLNLEANVVVLDAAFADALRGSLERLLAHSCERVCYEVPRKSFLRRLVLMVLYHVTRRMPWWGRWLRRRGQRKERVEPSPAKHKRIAD
jgi:cardiolipin synthase